MKALVLSSGGLDSTVCLADAVDEYGSENVISASIFYGQAHDKELECARKIADYYKVKHIEEDVSNVMKYAKDVCSLISGSSVEMKDKSYSDQIAEDGSPNTEVPFRNGLFLSIAASLAMSLFPNEDVAIVYGAHADDAAGNAYPDCSPEFAAAMSEAISIGSRDHLHVQRTLIHMNKSLVVARGLQLKVPFEMTWSCYHGREKACGVCGTCRDRIRAFRDNGVVDPVPYEIDNPFEDM